jgi:hypothetical protein
MWVVFELPSLAALRREWLAIADDFTILCYAFVEVGAAVWSASTFQEEPRQHIAPDDCPVVAQILNQVSFVDLHTAFVAEARELLFD